MTDREVEWAAWMRAANAGDGAAYRRLLAALAPYVRGAAQRLCRRHGAGLDDAEDVVQETLLAVHLKRHTWEEDKPIGPWLRAIVHHKFVDHLRRRGRKIHVPIDDLSGILPAPEERTDDRRDAERLIARLGGRQQEIVRAISLGGASIRETALRLGMTEGAVRVALHRGLKGLAALFRDGAE